MKKNQKLFTFASAVVCSFLFASSVSAESKFWTNVGANGLWSNGQNWTNSAGATGVPAAGDNAIFETVGGPVIVDNDFTIKSVEVLGAVNVVITVDNGRTLTVGNRGARGLLAIGGDLTVNGPGKLAISTAEATGSTGFNHLDNGSRAGRTLAINAEIIPGTVDTGSTTQTGFETWIDTLPGGDVILGYAQNDFTMNFNAGGGHVISVAKLGAAGQPSSVGSINNIMPSNLSVIRYTGTGDTAYYAFRLNGGTAPNLGGGIAQDGSGTLTWAGNIYNENNSAQMLTLRGDSPSPGIVTGNIYNNQNVLSLTKAGSGTWILKGTNTFTGSVTVNGGTLAFDSLAAATNATQITMGSGTTLSINPSQAGGFTVTFPPLVAAGSFTLNVAKPLSGASEVTFKGLSGAGNVAVFAQDAGDPANRIFITGLATGLVGPWLTLNGGPAQYTANGLEPATSLLTKEYLATKGSTIQQSGADIEAIINSIGLSGYISLNNNPTTLFSLTQTQADDATVDTAGKTLMAGTVAINAGADALSIGANPKDGTLLPPLQNISIPPPVIPNSTSISNLNPMIWYDPSEAANMSFTTTYGIVSVTNMVNKGWGVGMNAVVRPSAGWGGPVYVTGKASHAALPMLQVEASNQALQSASNTGITANSERTLFAVMSRTASNTEFPVGFGNNADAQDFTIVMLNTGVNTRFNTWNGDRDVASSSVGTPYVMTFFNNEDGNTSNTLSAAVNGVLSQPPWNARDTNLRTANTPFKLGYKNNDANAGRGQVGEVLLFNYTLDATQRQTVENYLMAKWQQPKPALTVQGATLTLRNDSAAPLTVNAAIAEPDGSTVALAKVGAGDVTLAGGVKLSGLVAMDSELTVKTPADLFDFFSGSISGAGKLVKDGPGMLILPPAAANTYTGGTDIRGGTLRVGNNRSLGTRGPVTIADGATLDLGGGLNDTLALAPNTFTVSGSGVGGQGAIVNNGPYRYGNVFNTSVTLAGDTTFGGTASWDIRGTAALPASLNFNGNTITKVGPNTFYLTTLSTVTGTPSGTAIHIKGGGVFFESSLDLYPKTPDPVIVMDSGTTLGMYLLDRPLPWTVVPADGAIIHVTGGTSTNQNRMTADMTLPPSGTLHLTASGAFNKNLAGQLSGTGGLSVHDGGTGAMSLLSNPANIFTGPVTVTNATLSLLYSSSLPDAQKLTVEANSAVRLYASTDRWGPGTLKAVAEKGRFSALNRVLQIEVGANESFSTPDDIGPPFLGTLDKYGAGPVAYNGNVTVAANARVFAGSVILTNDTTFLFGEVSGSAPGFYLADASDADCFLTVGGNAVLKHKDRGYNTASPDICIGTHVTSKTVAELRDNARIESKLYIGGRDAADTATVGALYQSGGTFLSLAGAGNDGMIGRYGYGYYQLDGGDFTLKGYTQLGAMGNAASVGILRQTGGTFTFNGMRWWTTTPANGTVQDSYNGYFSLSRGGTGILQLEGGTFDHYGALQILDNYGNTSSGGTAIMTVAGTDVMVDRQIEMGHRTNGVAIINLNAGKLTTTFIRRMNTSGSTATVNFNGGTLCVTNNTGNARLFMQEGGAPMSAFVHAKGATIEIGENVTRNVTLPLQRPGGTTVASIPVTAGGSGYIAPPQVVISGGGGSGATAFAHINRTTGQVTGIEITSPGSGYTSAPTVIFPARSGGGSGVTVGRVNLIHGGDGGLTKTGAGTLILSAANTYTGPTRVEQGNLILAHPQALMPQSEIIIHDGLLNLGGNTITTPSVTITGSGGIVNGKVITASAVKTGPGTATWGAEIEFATIITSSAIPGLWEGGVKGLPNAYWDLTTPNPKTSIQRTTRAGNLSQPNNGNGSANPMPDAPGMTTADFWGGNQNMWIYSGYLWNRETTNVLWTFRFSFDDNVSLTIDGNLLRNTGGGTVAYQNYILTPGPHPIEIRFGDNTGNVGAYSGKSGLTYDPFGRNNQVTADVDLYYTPLADDGTGWLLTATLDTEIAPDTAIRVQQGTLLLPPSITESTIAALNPIIWYDPSDPALVTQSGGTVTRLTNKAGTGASWDAVPGSRAAPSYATGGVSHAPRPMIQIGNNQGLQSATATGISGNNGRTIIAVMSRNTGQESIVSIGAGSARNAFEPYLRNDATRFGTYSNDLDHPDGPVPGETPTIMSMMNDVDFQPNRFQGWVNGVPASNGPKEDGVLNTSNTPLFLGSRNGANNYLGQIGEVLVFNGALPSFARETVEAYLRGKWTLGGTGTDTDFSGTVFDVSGGATLDLGGKNRDGIIITGDGNVTNGTVGPGTIISPAGDDLTGAMSVDGFGSLNGVTYRVTVHDFAPGAYANTPGLWEGHLNRSNAADYWDITTPNPKNRVVLTTRAGNIPGPAVANNSGNIIPGTGQPVSYFWNGNYNTWVYTGYIWNRGTTDVTWTWRFTFDDQVALWIDNKLVRFVTLAAGLQYANYTLTPGPHPIEIRFADGTGNVGPIAGSASGLMYTTVVGSTDVNDYQVLEDTGNGQLLTLTANIAPARVNDLITSTATYFDLAGLKIVPSDTISKTPPGSKYVIATLPPGGIFNGTPTIEGFEGKKWKTLRKGNELLLTTEGGTVMILR